MRESTDIVYVIAAKLGSIGIGSIAYNAVKEVDRRDDLSYKIFSRGYDPKLDLDRKNVSSYGYLETLSLPLRFMQKKMGLKIAPFKYINHFFGKGVKNNLPKCKIYHTWMGISPEAIKKAKRDGAILVLEGANSHPLNALEILNEEYKRLKKYEWIKDPKELEEQKKIIEMFDYVMCPSEFVYDSFKRYGFDKNQLIMMPYGVDPKRFEKKKKKKDEKFRVVFTGSIQVRKGVHHLLRAWEELKLKNAELIIVGRTWPDSFDIVEKYKDNKSIRFVGFEKNPEKYLSISDAFVSPSLEEGSALTCYEALASGLPVIATYNTGSVARDNNEGFIIPARDIKAMKEKIKFLYDNPKKLEKMGTAARKRAEEFSWDNFSKRLADKYKGLLDEKKANKKDK